MEYPVPLDVVYLDFQKVFDRVPYNSLISEVRVHEIGQHLHKWISDWFSNRLQRVILNGEAFDWIEVTSAVLHGSVSGSTLFAVYENHKEEKVM